MADDLPIDVVLAPLAEALGRERRAVLAAPPGAGKTTRVPLHLLKAGIAGAGRILMLEPRRLAARGAAERLASSIGEPVGATVGYRIRGESRVGRETRIEVVTEGVLTRLLQADPELDGYGCVIFDEVHERSIHSDLGLALCLEVQEALRPDLAVLAMSATVDTAAFAALMNDAPVITSEGRMFPVETRWLERPWRAGGVTGGRRHRALMAAMEALVVQAYGGTEGDLLVFLPGAREIEDLAGRLVPALPGAAIARLYGGLAFDAQRAALAPAPGGRRRVVVASAIAETSLTVPGVRIVVDSGLARRARVDSATAMSRLVTQPVSLAEAEQRRGRAGRTAPGWCFRLWTRGEEGAMQAYAPPEIRSTDLTPLALELAQWGAAGPEDLRFLDPPRPDAYGVATALLRDLGALDDSGRITEHGKAMAALPVHPRLAHMLVRARAEVLEAEAGLIAALLSERDPLTGDRRGRSDLRDRVRAIAGDTSLPADPGTLSRIRAEARRLSRGRWDRARAEAEAGRLAAMAYPDRIGLRRPGDAPRYLLSGGRGAALDPSDPLANARLLAVVDVEDGAEATIRGAVPVSEADLRDAHGDAIRRVDHVAWSGRARRVEARQREMLGALALSDEIWRDVPADALGAALADGVRDRGIGAIDWPKQADLLRRRVRWLRDGSLAAGGALAARLPDWSDEGLLLTLDDWLTPHLSGLRRIEEIGALDLAGLLRGRIDWELMQEIERLAPEHFVTPLGSRLAIDYGGAAPLVSVRVQELFGLDTHPVFGDPPQPLALELLSPARRPVQRTADLPGFWRSSWDDVRKDMRARYPRHPWPERPWEEAPTRRAKPRR